MAWPIKKLKTFLLALFCVYASGVGAAEISQLRTERSDDGIFLSALVHFELSPAIEDALLKGIAVYFVLEADIYRERWYWSDRRVASTVRTIRLAYQPLMRHWRVNTVYGTAAASSGFRTTFNQNYANLSDALAAIARTARWKIADVANIKAKTRHNLEFRFRLDLSLLPRPFQMGVVGQRDWTITAESTQALQLEWIKPVSSKTDLLDEESN